MVDISIRPVFVLRTLRLFESFDETREDEVPPGLDGLGLEHMLAYGENR